MQSCVLKLHGDRALIWRGDCLDRLKGIPDAFVELIATDTPYCLDGMGANWNHARLKARSRNRSSRTSAVDGLPTTMPFSKKQAPLYHDLMAKVSVEAFRVLKPGGFFVFLSSPRLAFAGTAAADEAGFEIRDVAVWEHGGGQGKACSHAHWVMKSRERTAAQKAVLVKEMTGLRTPQLRPAQEPIVVARKPCEGLEWQTFERYGTGYISVEFDGRQQTNVFRFDKPKARKEFDHMTVKPLPLMIRIVEVFSRPGQVVLDPFMGSGTTGEAALRAGRRFIGIEIDSHSYGVAAKRLAELDLPA